MGSSIPLSRRVRKLIPTSIRKAIGKRLMAKSKARWEQASKHARELTGGVVQAGPFKGMRYVDAARGSAYPPKLFGCYEKELHGDIETIVQMRPTHIVDLGAAEGYYAVGLLIRLSDAPTQVHGFEMNERGRGLMKEMAELNNVSDRLHIKGEATAEGLESLLNGLENPVLICDIEGGEADVLDPQAVPSLRGTAILVELHDFNVPGVTDLIKSRFKDTHTITVRTTQRRTTDDIPQGLNADVSVILPMMDELRPTDQSFLWMTPTA